VTATHIDFPAIDAILSGARADGRATLFEHEAYELLRCSGAETPPRYRILPRDARLADEELAAIPGDRVVMKIMSPDIVHKHAVGGVAFLENSPETIRAAQRRMRYDVAARYAEQIERDPTACPPRYAGLSGSALREAVDKEIRGVLLCQYLPPSAHGIGGELIVGIRRTREFGMVINAGLGGTDTEIYAARFRKGEAGIAAATALADGRAFFERFTRTLCYERIAGLLRGANRVVADEQLIECFDSFIALANHYSPLNPEAPFVLEELEVNPFAFRDFLMVPLDGHCAFSAPGPVPAPRPAAGVARLLRPARIAVVGVSRARVNIGRTILRNILSMGFAPGDVRVVHPEAGAIDGVACVPALAALGEPVDLLVLAVDAAQVPALAAEAVERRAAGAVLLVASGLGETRGSEALAEELGRAVASARALPDGPVFLGPNTMGVRSHPGRYDSFFIPEEKLPRRGGARRRRTAFLSQSGGYMITRMSALSFLDPAYAVSLGNQADLTAGDLLAALAADDDTDVVGVYLEGFRDLDGLAFTRAVKEAVGRGKAVLCYKAGRTPEGKRATSGHTASLAGDYVVCETCLHEAGAAVAQTFTEFEDLFRIAAALHDVPIRGNRIAAVSGAGFEAVGIADNIEGDAYRLALARFAPATEARVRAVLEAANLAALVDIKNPMDINPLADDAVHADIIRALADDPGVDAVVAGLDPLSPATQTRVVDAPGSIAALLPARLRGCATPVVMVVDGGALYDPLAAALDQAGFAVFRSADRAVRSLGVYIDMRLRAGTVRGR